MGGSGEDQRAAQAEVGEEKLSQLRENRLSGAGNGKGHVF